MKFDLSVTHRKPSGDCLLYLLYIVVLCMNHQLFVVNTSRACPNCKIVWTLSFKYLFGCHTYVFFGTVSFRRLNFVIIITTNISDVEDLLSYTNSDVIVRSTETIYAPKVMAFTKLSASLVCTHEDCISVLWVSLSEILTSDAHNPTKNKHTKSERPVIIAWHDKKLIM